VTEPVKRYPGKPIAIGLTVFLVIGTGLTMYYASRNMYARQRAFQAADAAAAAAGP
jgi:hypothetical protein